MNANDLREKSVDELNKEVKDLLREQCNLSLQRGMGGNPKPHLFGNARRKIARIKTILREKAEV